MKVLVACEFSGVVRDAFLAEGHDAISCDLLPTESRGPHIQGDVRPLLREPWDLVIAHPPCEKLSVARGKVDWAALPAAMGFFLDCRNANAPLVAVDRVTHFRVVQEMLGSPDSVVQPWQFGDHFKKRTCFWLIGLPPLMPVQAKPDDFIPHLISSGTNHANNRRHGVTSRPRSYRNRSRFHPWHGPRHGPAVG